ncbi:MAG: PorP/SprF family type IX secretion system membrane protein [Culturomica sp.]|jgi:type IX secretion system PorP/SprF family membrane protein|nr:PorP/SprF family type IX secretion system membrane protein [Culturomica sp.]
MQRVAKIYILLLMLLSVIDTKAQTDVQMSQHSLNRLIYNPAATGASEYINIMANIRDQWIGWTGAPRAQTLSFHNFVEHINSGLGVTIIRNSVGLENNMNAKLQYAYHVKLTEESYFSLGLGAGILYRYFDRNSAYYEDMVDNEEWLLNLDKQTNVDFDFGIEFNMYGLTAGFSIDHLTNPGSGDDKLYVGRHYYGFLKTLITIDDKWKVEPSFFVQSRQSLTYFEMMTTVRLRENVWFGLAYRTDSNFEGEAFVPLVGVNFTKGLRIGYSYDFNMGALSKYADATHEIFIGIRLQKNGLQNKRGYYRSPRFFE